MARVARLPLAGELDVGAVLELLAVLSDLIAVKLGRPAPAPGARSLLAAGLRTASRRIERLEGSRPDLPLSLRLQLAVLRLRLAERLPGGRAAACRKALLDTIAAGRPLAELWLRQDLGARFHWQHPAVPLAEVDPDLEALIVEAWA
jgi:hypothetical protein